MDDDVTVESGTTLLRLTEGYAKECDAKTLMTWLATTMVKNCRTRITPYVAAGKMATGECREVFAAVSSVRSDATYDEGTYGTSAICCDGEKIYIECEIPTNGSMTRHLYAPDTESRRIRLRGRWGTKARSFPRPKAGWSYRKIADAVLQMVKEGKEINDGENAKARAAVKAKNRAAFLSGKYGRKPEEVYADHDGRFVLKITGTDDEIEGYLKKLALP